MAAMGRLATVTAAVCDIPKSGTFMGECSRLFPTNMREEGGGVLGFWVTQSWREGLFLVKEV